jgi:oxygen-independent coproporphyrinogen-3 oxidase
MIFLNTDSPYKPDLEDVVRLYYPVVSREPVPLTLSFFCAEREGTLTVTVGLNGFSKTVQEANPVTVKLQKRLQKTLLYAFLREYTGISKPWGCLTGIRPTALGYELLRAGTPLDGVPEKMRSAFGLSQEKAETVGAVLAAQRGYITAAPDDFDLYINIPVCPSRCAYCSFISHELKKCQKLLPEYLRLLREEIDFTLNLLTGRGGTLRAVYIGGGTPSVLAAEDIDGLLAILPPARELTFEAGRPDTVSEEKFDILAERRVTRISLNPQTFREDALIAVGRGHTAEQFYAAYGLANRYPFSVNTDLIAGLDGGAAAELNADIDKCLELRPDNLTVHTLAVKAGSRLKLRDGVDASGADGFAGFSPYRKITSAGYIPYYLYRQKYMLAGLENIGYTVPDKQCLFNIDAMEETVSIAACGAGAISKAVSGSRIERAANVKNIDEYIARFTEMTEKKRRLFIS